MRLRVLLALLVIVGCEAGPNLASGSPAVAAAYASPASVRREESPMWIACDRAVARSSSPVAQTAWAEPQHRLSSKRVTRSFCTRDLLNARRRSTTPLAGPLA